jgi:hypothetical protein
MVKLGKLDIRAILSDLLLAIDFLMKAKKAAPGRKSSKHTPVVNSGSKKTLPL